MSLGRTDARGERRGRLFWQRATAGPADPFKPVEVEVRLDGTAFWHGPAAAVEVRNLALPGTSPDLAALEVGVLPAAAGGAGSPAPPAMRARAATVEVRARGRLPVRADGKLVGTTPATFRALPAALRLVPAAPLPVAAPARAIVLRPPALPVPAAGGPAGRAALAVVGDGALLRRLRRLRPLAVPLASAAGGAILGVLIAPLLGRLRRRPE